MIQLSVRFGSKFSFYFFLAFQIFLGGQETLKAESNATSSLSLQGLSSFALIVVSSNRAILEALHGLESARHQTGKKESGFRPIVRVAQQISKTTNRNYNVLTGIDQDYSTRGRGTGISIGQKTFLGNASLDLEKSKTDYAVGGSSYFESSYLSLLTGILRRDSAVNSIERKISFGNYRAEQARVDSIILDTLFESLKVLFDRLITEQTSLFKERNLEFYQKMLEEATVKLENGLGSELDLKQAKVKLSLAETDLKESRLSLCEVDRQLGLILGDPVWNKAIASMSPSDIVNLVPDVFDFAFLASQSLFMRPDIKLIMSELDVQRQESLLAKEQNRPNVQLKTRWGRQGRATDPELAHEKRDKSWDVTVSWETTFGHRPEGFERRTQLERLKALEIRREQAFQKAKKEISERIDRIKFYKHSLFTSRESLKLSAEILEGQRMNFSLGKTSLLDLLRYQSDYETSRLSVIRAEAVLGLSWLQLLYELGELPSFLGIRPRKGV